MIDRLHSIFSRIRSVFTMRKLDDDFAQELDSHFELLTEENIRRGMSPEEARRAARLKLGSEPALRETHHDQRTFRRLESFAQDLRFAFRMLRKNPGFTVVAVLTLALGIGANTAIFSLFDAVLLRDLPVKNPKELVLLGTGQGSGSTGGVDDVLYSYRFYEEFAAHNQVFSETSAVMSVLFRGMHGRIEGSQSLEPVDVQLVSGTYFSMLGVQPVLGSEFTKQDDEPLGAHAVAIVSYSWWTRRFSRDPAIIGKTLAIGPTLYTIIGVTPSGFFGTTVGQSPDVWIPLSMEAQVSPGWNGLEDKWWDSLYILARRKPGVSSARAEASINVLAKAIWRNFAGTVVAPDRQRNIEWTWISLTPAARGLSGLREYSLPLQILAVVVGLVLLIVCGNIANLLLARSNKRQREMSLRLAVGASRVRLFRQLLTESLLLACLSGFLGLLFATWASEALLAWVSSTADPVLLDVKPDARLLAFTFFVSVATALFFGTFPALRTASVELTDALKSGRGGSTLGARSRFSDGLVVSQIALSFVLLIGAGLFLRTLVNLTRVNTGFDGNNVLLYGIDPPDVGYKLDLRLVNLYQQLEQRVGAEPGVRAASVSFFTFNQGEWRTPVSVLGGGPSDSDTPHVLHNAVGPDYFATMRIPLVIGRVFGPEDTVTSPKVAVINQTMARLYFRGGSPIGRRFGMDNDPAHAADFEVIGVVADAKYLSLDEAPQPAAYYPYCQALHQFYYDFEVRYSGDPRVISAEVRSAASSVDPRLPLVYKGTLAEQVRASVASQSLVARLSAFFGLLAVFLASIGIYGLMSYGVARRTNEIGIRIALGATRPQVLWLILRQSLLLAGIGLLVGVPVAFAAERLVSGMLFGLGPTDPSTMAVAAVLLATLSAIAGYMPARRAMQVDPMVALRHE